MSSPSALHVVAIDGIGEVTAGDDLAAVVARGHGATRLSDGDVVVVTSKVLSKAERRVEAGDKASLVARETDRVLARRGGTSIVRTRHGLVLAAAGVDASNTAPGTALLLPVDPDASARRLRERLLDITGRNVAVVVSDTAGRAWRNGQTDIAIGVAGLEALDSYAGRVDPYGNELAVTAPALADEIAAAADLVKGKLGRRPVAVVRGLARLVLPPGSHGEGAVALVRHEEQDMFGLGAREAVVVAVSQHRDRPEGDTRPRGFGAPATGAEAAELLSEVAGTLARHVDDTVVVPMPEVPPRALGRWEARVAAAGVALGWHCDVAGDVVGPLRFTVMTP